MRQAHSLFHIPQGIRRFEENLHEFIQRPEKNNNLRRYNKEAFADFRQ